MIFFWIELLDKGLSYEVLIWLPNALDVTGHVVAARLVPLVILIKRAEDLVIGLMHKVIFRNKDLVQVFSPHLDVFLSWLNVHTI